MTKNESLELIIKQDGKCTGVFCCDCYFLRNVDGLTSSKFNLSANGIVNNCLKTVQIKQIIRERKLERILNELSI